MGNNTCNIRMNVGTVKGFRYVQLKSGNRGT